MDSRSYIHRLAAELGAQEEPPLSRQEVKEMEQESEGQALDQHALRPVVVLAMVPLVFATTRSLPSYPSCHPPPLQSPAQGAERDEGRSAPHPSIVPPNRACLLERRRAL